MKITIKHTLKFFAALVLLPVVLAVLLCIAVYLPPVQRWAINFVGEKMSESLGMRVSVEQVAITPFFRLHAGGLTVADVEGDTLIYASGLQFRVPLKPLFGMQADIKSFELSQAKLHTKSLIPDVAIEGVAESLVADVEGVAWQRQIVDVRRAVLEGADLNVTLTDTAAKDTTSTLVNWKILARDARISRSHLKLLLPPDSAQNILFTDVNIGNINMRQGNFDLGTALYDVNHLGLERCALTVGNFVRLKADTLADISRWSMAVDSVSVDSVLQVRALLRTLALHEKVYGLDLADGRGAIRLDTLGLRLPNLVLLTPNSRVEAAASVDWSALEPQGDGEMAVNLRTTLGRPDVADITRMLVAQGVVDRSLVVSPAVAPFLRGDMAFSADLVGNRRHLHLRSADLRMAQLLKVHADGNFYNDADRIDARLTANLAGGMLGVQAKGVLSQESYEVRGTASALPVSRFLDVPVGPLTGRFDVSGKGFDFTSPRTRLWADVEVKQLRAMRYLLDRLQFAADMQDGQAVGSMALESAIGNVSADLRASLKDGYALSGTVAADEVDLQRLANMESMLKLHTLLTVDASADKNFKTLALKGSVTESFLTAATRSSMFRDIFFNAGSSTDTTFANVSTGDLLLDFRAADNWRKLSRAGERIGREVTRQMRNKRFENDTLRHMLPVASLVFRAGTENPMSKYLALKGTKLSSVALELQTDSELGLHGYGNIGTISTKSLQLDTISCTLSHDDEGINFLTTVHNYKKNNPNLFTAGLNARLREEDALASLTFIDKEGRPGIDLSLRGELEDNDDGLRFSIDSKHPIIAYRTFGVNPDNGISINRKGMITANVQLSDSTGAGLAIYSVPTDERQNDITLSLSSVDLSAVSKVLPYAPRLGGMLEGDFHVMEQHGDSLGLSAMANISVSNLAYEDQPVGDVGTEIIYLPKAGGEHYADAFITFGGKDVGTCSAVYNDRDGHYRGEVNLQDFPLEPVNAFIAETGFGLRGFAGGTLSLEDADGKPRLSGMVDLNDAHFYSPVYGIDFLMDERPIEFADSRLTFTDYQLTSGKTALNVNGDIDFKNLDNIRIDFGLRASDFEVINSKRQKSSMIFGKVLADFDGSVRGSLSNLVVRGDVGVLAGTDATYLLSNSPLTVEDRLSDLVTFTSFEDSTYYASAVESETPGMSIDVSFGVHIDQGAKFHCFLSRNGESYVDVRGGGDLTFRMTPQGVTRLTGCYTIEEGEMNYELPVIPLKTFQLEQGSYAEFTGNMMNPRLSIRATERTRAVVTENDVQRKVNFNVGVEISRTLQDMGLAFTIAAPEDLSVQNELMTMSAEDRNKTAVALLATGMYVTDNLTSGIKASNALNAFLQSEIQNIAGKALSTIDVSFGMENNTSASGAATTDYSFQFSKRFLDDRISIKIGGSVQSGADADNSAASFIDNISLEYRLDKSGSRYVRVFYDREAHDLLEGSMMKTGAGLILRRKTDRLGELFLFRRKPKK